ncbi:MAG TPA: hypothetical protein EYQ27_07080 [Gemmatimonadetes bacterium]|nr:hypothetical protein [Gemmatimonadota bacterium]
MGARSGGRVGVRSGEALLTFGGTEGAGDLKAVGRNPHLGELLLETLPEHLEESTEVGRNVGGGRTPPHDPVAGAVLEFDESPHGKKGVPHLFARRSDAQRASTSYMLGVQESAQRVFFARRHDGEGPQDTFS